ncbi:unnamed protein product [marine sediment metagenome]|uniref:Uncharacterized protein n=1 Tax=marine sediment metagenome TaxID=412755 RepID=X1QL66_9ZZZZ
MTAQSSITAGTIAVHSCPILIEKSAEEMTVPLTSTWVPKILTMEPPD